jgi:lambda repressor-like predicted transcriptional regulator
MDQLEQKLKEYEEKKKQAEVEKITKLQKVRELLKNKNNSSSDIHPASIKSEELDKIVSNVASQSGEISILNNSLKNDLENLNKYQKTVAKKNFRIKKASF